MTSSKSGIVSSNDENNADESFLPPQIFANNSYSDPDDVKVYKRRWYILIMYSACFGIVPSLIWNTWGPIQATARAVFGWENYVIDLLSSWGPITYCFSIVPFSWLMDVKGLRVAFLLAAGLDVVGAALRCIPANDLTISTGFIHCGQIISGFAGPAGLAASALVSSTWFPPHQRTTATAICTMAAYAGMAVSFLIGPAFVDDVESTNIPKIGDNYVLNSTQEAKYRNQINTLLYVEAGVMLGLFLAVLFYYPARPPKPPSHSAATGRVEFKSGLKKLLKNYNYLLLVVLYGVTVGCYTGWLAVLDQNLSEFGLGVGQKLAGWLGFVAVATGSLSGILFSLFADHFSGHLKLFLIVFMAFSFYTILLICYVFTKVVPFNEIAVYVMFAVNGFFLNGTVPFFFEMGVELAYPVAEGITVGIMTLCFNFFQFVFLIVPLGHFGTKWMIWTFVLICSTSTIFLLFLKEKYNRSAIDKLSFGVSSYSPHNVNA